MNEIKILGVVCFIALLFWLFIDQITGRRKREPLQKRGDARFSAEDVKQQNADASQNKETTQSDAFDDWFSEWRKELALKDEQEKREKRKRGLVGGSTALIVLIGMIGFTYIGFKLFGELGGWISFGLLVIWWFFVIENKSKL